jgi:hypothetical protein
MKIIPWYKDQRFWKLWLIHSIIAIALGWYFVVPIFKLTFENGGLSYTNSTLWYFLFTYLSGVWLTQFFSFALYSVNTVRLRLAVLLGSYIQISLPIMAAFAAVKHLKVQSKWVQYLLGFICALIFWKILSEALAIYSIFLGELYFRVLS